LSRAHRPEPRDAELALLARTQVYAARPLPEPPEGVPHLPYVRLLSSSGRGGAAGERVVKLQVVSHAPCWGLLNITGAGALPAAAASDPDGRCRQLRLQTRMGAAGSCGFRPGSARCWQLRLQTRRGAC